MGLTACRKLIDRLNYNSSTVTYRGVHTPKPMMHIAHFPLYFNQIYKVPPIFVLSGLF